MRIKIEYPDNTLYTAEMPTRITDLNYGNHVGNDSLVGLLHEARVKWLLSCGFKSELDTGGAGLIMSGLSVEYIREIFYGDGLSVELTVADIRSVGFNIYYQVSVTRGEQKMLAAKALTSMVSFDYIIKKPVNIPAALSACF